MTRLPAKSLFVLLALGLWNLACPTALAEDDDPNGLNQLIEHGRYQEAIPIAERAVEVAKRVRGPEHPETADALNNLGLVFEKIGDSAKAEPLFQEALRIRQKVLGPEHPGTAQSLNNLAELYQAMDEYAKAKPLLQEALRVRQKVLGPENPLTAQSLNNLARLYRTMGEYAKAEPLFQEALPMHRSGLALAGAQTTIEAWKRDEVPPVENDGILTVEDVSTLDLQGTWLVTLSACDTGSGEARAGEGVMGLRRGFIQAGAQNLLMTLWPISDEVTVQIMSAFYQAAHNTGKAPEALAEVQRNWLLKLRTEKGLAQAVNLAGPFIMSSQGRP